MVRFEFTYLHIFKRKIVKAIKYSASDVNITIIVLLWFEINKKLIMG